MWHCGTQRIGTTGFVHAFDAFSLFYDENKPTSKLSYLNWFGNVNCIDGMSKPIRVHHEST
jgi:hypothetical protein